MPTKKQKKRKSRPKTSSNVAIDPSKYPIQAPPATGITAPYAYGPTYEDLPYSPRGVERIGGTDAEISVTTSGTKTTNIGTVSTSGILMNYNLSAAILGGTFLQPVRFRLDITRASDVIFSVNVIVAAVPGQNSIASNAEIMLQAGDTVDLVCVRGNMTTCTWSSAAQIMIQKIR